MQWGRSRWEHLKDSSWNLCWFQDHLKEATFLFNLGEPRKPRWYWCLQTSGTLRGGCRRWQLHLISLAWGWQLGVGGGGGAGINLDKSMERLWQILCKLQLSLQTYLLCVWKWQSKTLGPIKDQKGVFHLVFHVTESSSHSDRVLWSWIAFSSLAKKLGLIFPQFSFTLWSPASQSFRNTCAKDKYHPWFVEFKCCYVCLSSPGPARWER